MDAKKVGEIVRAAEPAVRGLYFAALLAKEGRISPDDVIVVGGSAVEVYTSGGYASGDLDIVVARDKATSILKEWGFERSGRLWAHRNWGIVVDLVKDPQDYTGSRGRTRLIETPHGSVRVEAVEDSMVRRLIQAKHWKVRGEFDLALAVAAAQQPSIDWDYAEKLARYELVADLLAEVRARLRRVPGR